MTFSNTLINTIIMLQVAGLTDAKISGDLDMSRLKLNQIRNSTEYKQRADEVYNLLRTILRNWK